MSDSFISLRFPPINGGMIEGASSGEIETFSGTRLYDNIVRELAQNTIDARNPNSDKPARLVFKREKLRKSSFDLFSELDWYRESCEKHWGDDADDNLRSFLIDARRCLSAKEINVLVASDSNTTGLQGSHSSYTANTQWNSLVGSRGVSKKKSGSGGSHGIGKFATFAASRLHTVAYNTFAIDGYRAFQATCSMASLKDREGVETLSIGSYRYNDNDNPDENEAWRPIYPEDTCQLRDHFHRDEYGTDVIILGYKDTRNDWAERLIKHALKNFMLALLDNLIEIQVDDTIINHETFEALLDERSSDSILRNTCQYYDAYRNGTRYDADFLKTGKDDVSLFIKGDDNYHKGIARFRKTGMLVKTQARRQLRSFAGVLVVHGDSLNDLLTLSEPPAHDDWDPGQITDKDQNKRAKDALKEINDFEKRCLNDLIQINEELIVDADIGDYLPDSISPGRDNTGKPIDALSAQQRLGTLMKREASPNQTETASMGKGSPTNGTPRNSSRSNKNPNLNTKPSAIEGKGDKPGSKKTDSGTKSVESFVEPNHRIFAISAKNGIYKLLIESENTQSVYVSLGSIGDNNESQKLSIKNCKCQGRTLPIQDNEIGPLELSPGINEFIITFADSGYLFLTTSMRGAK